MIRTRDKLNSLTTMNLYVSTLCSTSSIPLYKRHIVYMCCVLSESVMSGIGRVSGNNPNII